MKLYKSVLNPICPKVRFMGLHVRTSKIVMLIVRASLRKTWSWPSFWWIWVVFLAPWNRYETDFLAFYQMSRVWADVLRGIVQPNISCTNHIYRLQRGWSHAQLIVTWTESGLDCWAHLLNVLCLEALAWPGPWTSLPPITILAKETPEIIG